MNESLFKAYSVCYHGCNCLQRSYHAVYLLKTALIVMDTWQLLFMLHEPYRHLNLSAFPVTDRRSAPSRVLLSTSFDSSLRLAIDIENDTPYSMTSQGNTKKRRIVDGSISRCPMPMLMQLIVHLCSKSVRRAFGYRS
jgi:hypothetical protein